MKKNHKIIELASWEVPKITETLFEERGKNIFSIKDSFFQKNKIDPFEIDDLNSVDSAIEEIIYSTIEASDIYNKLASDIDAGLIAPVSIEELFNRKKEKNLTMSEVVDSLYK